MTRKPQKPQSPAPKRDKMLIIRVTEADLKRFDAAAATDDRKRAEWCRRVLHAAADKLLGPEKPD